MKGLKAANVDGGIKAVAKALNLSPSTVSRALNGVYGVNPATRELIQETAKAMGYVPHLGAKQLVGKSSNLIGVFFPQFEFEASSGFVDMFSPLQQALQRNGKDALFFSIPFLNYPNNLLTECISSRSLEGCLLLPAFSESHPMVQEALKLQIPCVNFEDVVGPHCSSVITDDREGGRLAGRKLFAEGHQIIGYINGPAHIRICKDRYGGFCEALMEAGIEHDASLVGNGDFSGSSGAQAAKALKQLHPEMTAIFCANDLMAMGAIMEFTSNGISVPESLSIIGFDGDSYTAYTAPPLTTISIQREDVSTRAIELLMELLTGHPGRKSSIPPKLLERQSVMKRSNNN
ncbi:DNA-binding transcriptional regulator CytR [Cohnella abietis]|uniref:DNA-binding transcriptional regulator CytR n=1 Tax=Cohnella abietis TaxID=2507935 RepID=A0A3T1DB42_9BACL|nr:DNA-binding transcriptional regulator CytR [Cohnella abietis]